MRLAIALALITMTTTFAAWAAESWPTFGSPSVFTEQGGEAVYRSVCAGCHMPDGRGASGAGRYPSLADDPRLVASSYPVGMVLKGRKAMPSFSNTLTDEQVVAVVTYVRTHFGNNFIDVLTAANVAAER